MTSTSDVLDLIEREEVRTVDLRFTDLAGQWRRIGFAADAVDAAMLDGGVMFDGSAMTGWRDVAHSDMLLKPDPASAVLDPFTAQPSLILISDVAEPGTGLGYDRCPRSIARRAAEHVVKGALAADAVFMPQAEFFVFDDVRFSAAPTGSFFDVDTEEASHNSATRYETGNRGHRAGRSGAPLAAPPIDQGGDLRAEMASMLRQMGRAALHHHHDIAPGQHQISLGPEALLPAADGFQIYKHVVHSVAAAYGKSATFMPKPLAGQPGSGMQIRMKLLAGDRPVFAGNGYADLSETCLHFIAGILGHARALNAILNPTTNSYRRLAPGEVAPRHLAFAALNRSAAVRLPFADRPEEKSVEIRFADPAANPYLAFAAVLLAGLDGVERKLDPGEPIDRNLYDLPPEEMDELPTVCRSLDAAVDELDRDRDFLIRHDIFTDELIDSLIQLRRWEIEAVERIPHPAEFQLYYSV